MIFFDIDGTLIDHISASAAASLRLYDHFAGAIPFGRKQFPLVWEEILTKHFDRFCRGELSVWGQRRARMRDVFAAPELTDEEADARYRVFIREYELLTCAFDDAAPCLEGLGREPLGIISNGVREQQIGKLERAGLMKYFSVQVFSDDTGLGKPAPRIFIEACHRAEAIPAECVYVGDSLEGDVVPARAIGMQAVWLDRAGTQNYPAGVRRITTLRDLPAILGTATVHKEEKTPFGKHDPLASGSLLSDADG
jgi:putative hydrolase of the HAD superfamily